MESALVLLTWSITRIASHNDVGRRWIGLGLGLGLGWEVVGSYDTFHESRWLDDWEGRSRIGQSGSNLILFSWRDLADGRDKIDSLIDSMSDVSVGAIITRDILPYDSTAPPYIPKFKEMSRSRCNVPTPFFFY